MTNFTFNVKVKSTSFKLVRVHEFMNLSEFMINEQFQCKGKNLKLIFCKFGGQLDFEDQVQGHKFLKYARP